MHVPDPVGGRVDGIDPEDEALLVDAVGLALLVVLDTLAPAERLAFVLHDMLAVPYDPIGPMVARSPNAAAQLAARARRRVQGAATPDGGISRPGLSTLTRGAATVARQALTFGRLSPFVRPILVNGAAGVIVAPRGRPISVMGFIVRRGKIIEIDTLADAERLHRLDLAILDD